MKRKLNLEKIQYLNLFLIVTFILLTMPLFLTTQDLLTRILSVTGIAGIIQDYIIPLEVKFVAAILLFLKIEVVASDRLIVLYQQGIEVFRAQIIWSCIGWQSIVLLLVTLGTGLSGHYVFRSKLETIVLGLLGTFWINIIRIVIIYILGYYFGQLPAVIFHNFASTLTLMIWLFFYWWFAYNFILEEKRT